MHAEAPADRSNVLEATVVHREFLGGRWRHVVRAGTNLTLQLLTAEKAHHSRVWVRFPVERCLVLAEDGTSIQPGAGAPGAG